MSASPKPDRDLELLDQLAKARTALTTQIGRRIIGQQKTVEDLVAALLAGGHVLLVGVPGLAKTLLVQTIAQALELSFSRVQFTPDLMPSDITGTELLEEEHSTGRRFFKFAKGPIFANIVLADEINRAPPKTQAALLEAMQEHRVTSGETTYDLPEPFFVLATQNPIEQEGTYPLPEAQLDRFLLRVAFGYPTADEEYDVVARRLERQREEVSVEAVTDAAGLAAVQAAVERIQVDQSVGRYCVALAEATRAHSDVLIGASPRGSLGLVLAARGWALIRGRDYVIPEDVKVVARSVLAHRITVRPELWMTDVTGARVVDDVLGRVPTPATLEATRQP